MKKTRMIFGMVFSCLLATSTITLANSSSFCIYNQKNLKSQCHQTSITMPFVTIIRQGDWAKVGLKDANGTVCWLKVSQYVAKKNQLMQPKVQSVYVTVSKDKDGKPVYNILAYKNGKPVSKEQAKKLYDQLRRNQKLEQNKFNQLNSAMQKMMSSDLLSVQKIWLDAFPNLNFQMPILQSKEADVKG